MEKGGGRRNKKIKGKDKNKGKNRLETLSFVFWSN